MHDFTTAFATALALIVELDHDLVAIVCLSLVVSLAAVSLAAVCGLPLGAAVAVCRFPGRGLVGALLNAMMGLPPVVVGLALYVLLSRAGPLGELGLLYTPTAMILAQCVLVTPIIAALTRQTIADLYEEYDEQLRSLDVGPYRTIGTLLWDGRFRLLTAVLAGLGRASAEVGAVLIVGGNINHVTRVMTTTIALETSKGDLPLALGLGIILVLLTFMLNAAALAIRNVTKRAYG
jgi:tungstate transport system permease protein